MEPVGRGRHDRSLQRDVELHRRRRWRHQLSARARDAAGNQTTATAVAVTVHNTVSLPLRA